MKNIPYSDKYHDNAEKCIDDEIPCCICGNPIATPTHWVTLSEGGGYALTPEEESATPNNMGSYPIGPTCRRKHGKHLKGHITKE